MTNLLAKLSIVLLLATNWTGVHVGTNELGYVVTNHAAKITYQDKEHEFTLLSQPSDIAVWRPTQTVRIYGSPWLTNFYFKDAIVTTNGRE